MLRTFSVRLFAAPSLSALLLAAPALAQDRPAASDHVVPPNPISMPTAGPVVDSATQPPAAPQQQAAPEPMRLPSPAPVATLDRPAAQPTTPPQIAAPSPQPSASPAPVVEAKPAFSLSSELDERLKRERSTIAADRADRDALAKFYDARKGEPLWVTADGPTANAKALAAEIAAADAYALDAKAFRLPKMDAGSNDLADVEITLALAALKYARHARGGRMDPQQLSPFIDRKAQVLPPAEVLDGLAKASAPGAYLAGLNPQTKAFAALKQKLADVRSGRHRAEVVDPSQAAPNPPTTSKSAKGKRPAEQKPKELTAAQLERKLIANMEMWRWLPDMGAYHIAANVPEYQFRVIRNGEVIHQERMVVGKNETQTPLFSETMKVLVFKPVWNVPNGIKIRDLLPQLARNRGALTKAGLKANYGGREVDPSTVDFATVDIRNLHIFQPSGPSNAMGQVKFLFPNKHDIYFHDTPLKPLFNSAVRTLSNGCMRVRDPLKFAELLLAQDKGWDRSRIASYVSAKAADNQEVRLSQPVPVHITYFTAWVDEQGALKLANDVYGHEQRIHMGLEGKAHLIPKPKRLEETKPVFLERRPVQLAPNARPSDAGNWVQKLFNF